MAALFRRLSARWDRLLPLGTIVVFIIIGIPVATGSFGFGLEKADADRFQTIYTDIGIQTTAGIFAIVISLSLVAIQFAAQEYSHRIMEYYIKSSVFWSTVAVYLGLMIAAIFMQASSTDEDNPRAVGIILLGSVLALVLLVPHFIVTAAFLKPEFIVQKLMGRLTPSYLERVERTGHGEYVGTSKDRLLPVMEIAERSIEKGDTATANAVVERIVVLAGAANGFGRVNTGLFGYFIADLNRVGRKAISAADEEAVAAGVVGAIAKLSSGAEIQAASSIDDLLASAVRHQQEGTISAAIGALTDLYSAPGEEVRVLIDDTLAATIPRLAENGHRLLLLDLVGKIEALAASRIEQGGSPSRFVDLLELTGGQGAAHRLVGVVRTVAASMATIGKLVAPADAQLARNIVLSLLRIERAIDSADPTLIAAVGFSRSEVERLIGGEALGNAANDFSDVWDEPDDES